MTTPRFNFVRFVPSGLGEGEGAPVLRLSLESAWHLACGIEPDVNTAIVPAGDFEILRERMAAREAAGDPARPPAALLTGAVEMRMAGAGQADYRIAPITIVEAEPATIAPALAGDLQRSARAYRVYLADMRHNWIAPRGGNLRIGLVNRRDDPDPRPNTRLIEICLSLMGLAGTAGPPRYIDADLDLLPPVRDLDWRGAHAPTELWRICQELGATIAITSDGGVRVELEGRGPAPLVPAERSLGALEPVVPLLPGSALSAPATAPPVGSPVKWGKVAESWNNGNTVLLTPCAGQQDGTPTGQSVIAYIVHPYDMSPRPLDLVEGAIVPYVTVGDVSLLLPVRVATLDLKNSGSTAIATTRQINIPAATNGVLAFDGSDLKLGSGSDGQVLIWDNSQGKWVIDWVWLV